MPHNIDVNDDGRKTAANVLFSMSTLIPTTIYGMYRYLSGVHGSEKTAALMLKIVEGLEDPSIKAYRDSMRRSRANRATNMLGYLAPRPVSSPTHINAVNSVDAQLERASMLTQFDWAGTSQQLSATKTKLRELEHSLKVNRGLMRNRLNTREANRYRKIVIDLKEQQKQLSISLRQTLSHAASATGYRLQDIRQIVNNIRDNTTLFTPELVSRFQRAAEKRVAKIMRIPTGLLDDPHRDPTLLERIHAHPKYGELLNRYTHQQLLRQNTYQFDEAEWVNLRDAHRRLAEFLDRPRAGPNAWSRLIAERSGDLTTNTATTISDKLKQQMLKHLPAEHLFGRKGSAIMDRNADAVIQVYQALRHEMLSELQQRGEMRRAFLGAEVRRLDNTFYTARFRMRMQPRSASMRPVEAVFEMPLAIQGQARASIATSIRNVGWFAVPQAGFDIHRIDDAGFYRPLIRRKDVRNFTQRVAELASRTSKSMIEAMSHGIPTDAERMWQGLINKTLRYASPSVGSERDLTLANVVRIQSNLNSIGKYNRHKLRQILTGIESLKRMRQAVTLGQDIIFWDTEYLSRELMEQASRARNVPLDHTVSPYGLGAVRINPALGESAFGKAQVISKVYRLPERLQLGMNWLSNYAPKLKKMGLAAAINRAFHDKSLPQPIKIFKDLTEMTNLQGHTQAAFTAGANLTGADMPMLRTLYKQSGYKAPRAPLFMKEEFAIDIESIYRLLGGMDDTKSYSLSELVKRHGLEEKVNQSYLKAFGSSGLQDEFLRRVVQSGNFDPKQIRKTHMAAYDALAAAHLAMDKSLLNLMRDDKFFEHLARFQNRVEKLILNPRLSPHDNIEAILNYEQGQAMYGEGGGNEMLRMFSASASQASAQKGAFGLQAPWAIGPFGAFANWSRPQSAYWSHRPLTRAGIARALRHARQLGVPLFGGVVEAGELAWRQEQWKTKKKLFFSPMRLAFLEAHDVAEDTVVLSKRFYERFLEAFGPTKRISVDLAKETLHRDLVEKVKEFIRRKDAGRKTQMELAVDLGEGVPLVRDAEGRIYSAEKGAHSVLTDVLADPDQPDKVVLEYATIHGRLDDIAANHARNVLGIKLSVGKTKMTVSGAMSTLRAFSGDEVDAALTAKHAKRKEFGDAVTYWLDDMLHEVDYVENKVNKIAATLFGKEAKQFVAPIGRSEAIGAGKARIVIKNFEPGGAQYERVAKIFTADPFQRTMAGQYQWDKSGRLVLKKAEEELSRAERERLKLFRMVNRVWDKKRLDTARRSVEELQNYIDQNFRGKPQHTQYCLEMNKQLEELRHLYGDTIRENFERADDELIHIMYDKPGARPVIGATYTRIVHAGIFEGGNRFEYANQAAGFQRKATGMVEGAVRLNSIDANVINAAVEALLNNPNNGLNQEQIMAIRQGLVAQRGYNLITEPTTGARIIRDQVDEQLKTAYTLGATKELGEALTDKELKALANLRSSITDPGLLRKLRAAPFYEYEGRIFDSIEAIHDAFGEEIDPQDIKQIAGERHLMSRQAYEYSSLYRKGNWSEGKGVLTFNLGRTYDFDLAQEILDNLTDNNEKVKLARELRRFGLDGRFRGSALRIPLLRSGADSSLDSRVRIASKQESALINLARVLAAKDQEEVPRAVAKAVDVTLDTINSRRTGITAQREAFHFPIAMQGTVAKIDAPTFMDFTHGAPSGQGYGFQELTLSRKHLQALADEAVRFGAVSREEANAVMRGERPLRGIFTRQPINPSATYPSGRAAFVNAYIDKTNQLPDGAIGVNTMTLIRYGGDYDGDIAQFMVFNDKRFYELHQGLRNHQIQTFVNEMSDIRDKHYIQFFEKGVDTGAGYKLRLTRRTEMIGGAPQVNYRYETIAATTRLSAGEESLQNIMTGMNKQIFGDAGTLQQIRKTGLWNFVAEETRTFHKLKQYAPILGYLSKQLSVQMGVMMTLSQGNIELPEIFKRLNPARENRMAAVMGDVVQSAIQKYFSDPTLKSRINFDNIIESAKRDYELFRGKPGPAENPLENVILSGEKQSKYTALDLFRDLSEDRERPLRRVGGVEEIRQMFDDHVEMLDWIRRQKQGGALLRMRYAIETGKQDVDLATKLLFGQSWHADLPEGFLEQAVGHQAASRYRHPAWDVGNRWGALGDFFRQHPSRGKIALATFGSLAALNLFFPNQVEKSLGGMAGYSSEQFDWSDRLPSMERGREIIQQMWSNSATKVTRLSPSAKDRNEARRQKAREKQNEQLVNAIYGAPGQDVSLRHTDLRTRMDRGVLERWRNLAR